MGLSDSNGREVLGVGLEPTFLAEPDPKSGASANFATRACKMDRWTRRRAEGVHIQCPV